MPNGRNAERIFGRNADRAECRRAECRQLLANFGRNAENEGAEMKVCPWQKYQVPLVVFVDVYSIAYVYIYFVSITKPRT